MTHNNSQYRWLGLLTIVGGGIWIAAGSSLAMRPAGVPPYSYRATADMVPWLGLGLLLIGGSIGGWLVPYRHHIGRLGRLSMLLTFGGVISYALGSSVRAGFLSGGWEPFLPVGFLVLVVGLLLAGIASLRGQVLPPIARLLLIVAAPTLLFMNDQFTPWMAVPFGVISVVLGFLLLLRPDRTYRAVEDKPAGGAAA